MRWEPWYRIEADHLHTNIQFKTLIAGGLLILVYLGVTIIWSKMTPANEAHYKTY